MSDPVSFTLEVHFQEVFSGEEIHIYVNGRRRASLTARTRFQTGLAAIETLEVHEGEEVMITTDDNAQARTSAASAYPYIIVKMVGGRLDLQSAAQQPGYL